MFRQKIVIGIVTLAIFSTAAIAVGQESSQQKPQSTSLFGQLDQFGKKLVGGIFPDKSNNTAQQRKVVNPPSRYRRAAMQKGFTQSHAGSNVQQPEQQTEQKSSQQTLVRRGSVNYQPHPLGKKTTSSIQRPVDHPSLDCRVAVVKDNSTRKTTAVQHNTPVAKAQSSEKAPSVKNAGASPPLHKRLMGFTRSAFSSKPKEPASQQATVGEKKVADENAVMSKSADKVDPRRTQPHVTKSVQQDTVQYVTVKNSTAKKTLNNIDSDPDVAAALGQSLATPKIAARQTPTVAPQNPVAKKTATKTVLPTKSPLRKKASVAKDVVKADIPRTDIPKAETPTKARTKPGVSNAGVANAGVANAGIANAGVANEDVLFERHSPMLNVRTMGPRHITVGKESTYTVFIDNLGKAEAAEVVVTLELPEWADVLGADPSQGATRSLHSSNGMRQFDWRVGSLEAGASEKIALRIVPRESRAIDMGVSWDFKPAASQTVIEVQQPKMEIHLDGPREVAFGKSQKYKLEIFNTGNGPAEDVAITLMPVAVGCGLPSTHQLGAFPAGKKMVLEISLTPRQTDGLAVKVDLHNEGKICAQLNENILVRKAQLEMVADGPSMQYVGTVATYRIRLRNTGNAPATNLNVAARIPSEAKYLESDNSGKLLEDEGKTIWSVESLAPGSMKILELKCELLQAGFNRIDVQTTADDQLQASTAVATNVEAMADLTLNVTDPPGPVPVGKEAVYELRIRNRGSKRAEDVDAVAYFSQGIEPVSVSGGMHKIGAGQVIFEGIDTLEAGQEVVYKITARADMPGNHMFRAEVHCRPLNTKLVHEETTHFFNGTLVADRPSVPRKTASRPTLAPAVKKSRNTSNTTVEQTPKTTVLEETRTVDRRNLLTGADMRTKAAQPEKQPSQKASIGSRYRLEQR